MKGIAAAKFEHNFLDALRGGDSNLDAGLLASGERGRDHARVVENCVDLLRADQQSLKCACGESGFEKNLFNRQRTLRNVRCVLQQSDVAGHERRSGEAEDLPEGKVPGHHGENRADGTVADETFLGAGFDDFVGQKFLSVIGVVAAASGALHASATAAL